jgi:hypothetical protein
MKMHMTTVSRLLLLCLFFTACKKDISSDATAPADGNSDVTKKKPSQEATMTVFATGLNNPRGLKFGPDGNLYVAEAGVGGSVSSADPSTCPFTGSSNGGRVSRIDGNGNRTTVSDQLPSSQGEETGVTGPADVAFVGNQLYVLIDGEGCLPNVSNLFNSIVRLGAGGTPTRITDLGRWLLQHPPANPSQDFDPTGVWYSLIQYGKGLYALNANQGTLLDVTTDGSLKLVTDMSATVGHIVPTVLAERGNVYMSNLGTFPIMNQSAIYKITPSGHTKEVVSGFSAVLGLVIDQQSRMYVLEMTYGAPFPTPGHGRIVKVEPNGEKQVIADGLNLPTGMTMGPDGNLYVSNWGFGKPPGGGEIVKVTVSQ